MLETNLECWQSRLLFLLVLLCHCMWWRHETSFSNKAEVSGENRVLCKKNSNTAFWVKEVTLCWSSLVSCTVLCYHDEDSCHLSFNNILTVKSTALKRFCLEIKRKQGCVLMKGDAFHPSPRYKPRNGYLRARHAMLDSFKCHPFPVYDN